MIPTAIEKVQNICDGMLSTDNLDDFEKNALTSRCREILLQGFRFGFEVHVLIQFRKILHYVLPF